MHVGEVTVRRDRITDCSDIVKVDNLIVAVGVSLETHLHGGRAIGYHAEFTFIRGQSVLFSKVQRVQGDGNTFARFAKPQDNVVQKITTAYRGIECDNRENVVSRVEYLSRRSNFRSFENIDVSKDFGVDIAVGCRRK